MNRDQMLDQLGKGGVEVLVIGGGASGLGCAVDAANRGFKVALLEAYDFAKATSSRSTKLVHGGVRYLQQGNVSLVLEALRERGLLYENAPHLVHDLAFVVPRYRWWEGPFYGVGLKMYDALARDRNLAPSSWMDREETLHEIPNVEPEGLIGGVRYYDAQFDDARMALTLARTAADHDAILLNYMNVTGLTNERGQVTGVVAVDQETDQEHRIAAKVVINACGIYSDQVRQLDNPNAPTMTRLSQGVHIVLDRSFQPSDSAIMVPRTDDGRILFVIPWHERVLVGTTDTPVDQPQLEPRAFPEEIEFILHNAGRYLDHDPTRADVLSVFAGLRPLVRDTDEGEDTKKISREHVVMVSPTGLVTLLGGKWTTYRKMAQDTVDDAVSVGGLHGLPCRTETLRLHGSMSPDDPSFPKEGYLQAYGTEFEQVLSLGEENPAWAALLHPNFPYREFTVVWAARHEMARTVEDVLSRRTRALLMDARASIEIAPRVAEILAEELGRPPGWAEAQVKAYRALAAGYLIA